MKSGGNSKKESVKKYLCASCTRMGQAPGGSSKVVGRSEVEGVGGVGARGKYYYMAFAPVLL